MIKWSKSNEFHPGTERGTACTSLSKLQFKVEAFSSCSSTEKDAFLKALGWLSSSWRYLEGTQKSHTCLASSCSTRATDLLPPVSTSLPRETAAACCTLPQVCERRAPGRDASDNPNRQQLQNFWIHRVSFYFFFFNSWLLSLEQNPYLYLRWPRNHRRLVSTQDRLKNLTANRCVLYLREGCK